MVSCVRLTSCINRTMSEDRAIGDIKICATFIRTDVGVISIVITSTVRSAYSQNQLFVATFRDRFWDSALRKAKSGAAVTGSYSKTESRERIPVTDAWRHILSSHGLHHSFLFQKQFSPSIFLHISFLDSPIGDGITAFGWAALAEFPYSPTRGHAVSIG